MSLYLLTLAFQQVPNHVPVIKSTTTLAKRKHFYVKMIMSTLSLNTQAQHFYHLKYKVVTASSISATHH